MKKQLFLKICAVAAVSVMVFACKKEQTSTKPSLSISNSSTAFNSGSDNVYVSGFYSFSTMPTARYWVNTGSPVDLNNGTTTNGHAYDIEVTSGGDIYAIGTLGTSTGTNPGVVWKNGSSVSLPLPAGSSSAEPRMVYSNGSDIYIAGITWYSSGSIKEATYWKIPGGNTGSITATVVGTSGSNSDAFGIALSGTDVYVVGTAVVSGVAATVVYWVNGTQTNIGGGTITNGRPQILNIGTDIYIAAAQNDLTAHTTTMYLFKNGATYSPSSPITGGPTTVVSSYGLATDGTNLFIEYAGNDGIGQSKIKIWIWKNGGAPLYTLNDAQLQTIGTDFNCFGAGPSGSCYLAGHDSSGPLYWIDGGSPVHLSGATNNNITGICVR